MSTDPISGLTVSGISCRRHERLLFDELSFRLDGGEMLEIRGANGSGKTSLLRMLCGLRRPDTGVIAWQGRAIHEDQPGFRAQLCSIGHKPGLNGDLSALENLRLEAALFAADDQRVSGALSELGLQREQNLPCRLLSAGQRQRASLARLLIRSTRLWILDEPCASLDRAAQSQVQALMLRHARDGGCVVFTTHQPLPFDGVQVPQLTLGGMY